MLKPVQKAHREYNSLADQIQAKCKQLDSGKFGELAPQHSMLKLVNWLIYLLMSANYVKNWTCQHPRNSTGPCSSSIEDAFWI